MKVHEDLLGPPHSTHTSSDIQSKEKGNDQELIQSNPTSHTLITVCYRTGFLSEAAVTTSIVNLLKTTFTGGRTVN